MARSLQEKPGGSTILLLFPATEVAPRPPPRASDPMIKKASELVLRPAVTLAAVLAPLHPSAGATPSAPSGPELASASVPHARDYASELARAEKAQLAALLELADWCQENKTYLHRDKAYELVLEYDPDHKQARKFLKYSWDRKKEEWVRKRPYKAPKEGDEEVAAEAIEKRTALQSAFVDKQIDLVEKHRDDLGPAKSKEQLNALLEEHPDNARLREMMGYVSVDAGGEIKWTTQVALDTEKARKSIATALEKHQDAVPEPVAAESTDAENEWGVEWTGGAKTDRVRVVENNELGEAEAVVRAVHAEWPFLRDLIGGKLECPKSMTVFVVDGDDARTALMQNYPDLTEDQRELYVQLISGWFSAYRLGCWGNYDAQRIDSAVMQMSTYYLKAEFDVESTSGWAVLGIGLYVNQMMLGTRLSYPITQTEYDDKTDAKDRNIEDTDSDWMEIAVDVLSEANPTFLAATLGRNTSEMTQDDLVCSYALAAYLCEGYGKEKIEAILRAIGKGQGSSVAILERELDGTLPEIQARLLEWLEEVGGHDF